MLRTKASFLLRFLVFTVIVMLVAAVLPAQAQSDFRCSDLARQSDGDITVDSADGDASANGVVGDVFCRVIVRDTGVNTSLSEIGVQSVINQPIVQAINVYGLLPDGTTVRPFTSPIYICMRGQGDLIFLNSFDTSKTPIDWGADDASPSGYTCAYFEVAGIVVLVGSLNAPVTVPARSVPDSAYACHVTTRATLHVRELPGTDNPIVATLPAKTTLPAVYHSMGWYLVVYASNNTQGWVSGSYITTKGNCS